MCKTKKTNCKKAITMIMLIALIAVVTMSCTDSRLTVTAIQSDQVNENEHDIPSFDEKLHDPNKLLAIFDVETAGWFSLGYMPEKDDAGYIQIGHESFDKLSQKYGIVSMFQQRLYHECCVPDYFVWLGYPPENIFILTIKDSTMIEMALQDLFQNDAIFEVNYVNKENPKDWDRCPVSLWVYFDDQIHGFFEWEFKYEKNSNGQIQIGIESFDALAVKHNFTDFHQLQIGLFRNSDWETPEYSPMNNVFRIVTDGSSKIESIYQDLLNDSSIFDVSYNHNKFWQDCVEFGLCEF